MGVHRVVLDSVAPAAAGTSPEIAAAVASSAAMRFMSFPLPS